MPAYLQPVVTQIMELVRGADVVLATGHLSVPEIMAVLDAARDMGLRRVVINHPTFITEATDDDMVEFVARGAMIEFSASMTDPRSKFYFMPPAELHRIIRLIGLERRVGGLGPGTARQPPPFIEGLMKVADGLLAKGMTIEELGILFGGNAKKLLY